MAKVKASKTPLGVTEDQNAKQGSVSNILLGLQQEIDKIKGKIQNEGHAINMIQAEEYAGNNYTCIVSSLQSLITTFHTTYGILENLDSDSWILDTGATMHMCAKHKLFSHLSSTPYNIPIKLPDGRLNHVTQIGDVNLTSKLSIKDVLYTPTFRFNLLYVNKLANSAQIKFTFFPSYCLLHDLRTKEVIAKGKTIGSLYVFDKFSIVSNKTKANDDCNNRGSSDFNRYSNNIVCNQSSDQLNNKSAGHSFPSSSLDTSSKFTSNETPSHEDNNYNTCKTGSSHLHIWHKRLTHTSYITLHHLNSPDISLVLNAGEKENLQACEVCHKAKQTRLPFNQRTSDTTTILKLVHLDLLGPYSQPSLTGTNYMLALVDDFSRATWTYLLQHKNQTTTTFEGFIKMVNTQFETNIKSVRTDNGIEFINS